MTERGYGKRTPISDHPVQTRGGKGVIAIKTSARNGPVVSVKRVTEDEELMMIANAGKVIRMPVAQISEIGRNTQGVRLIHLSDDEKVADVARLAERDEEEPEDGVAPAVEGTPPASE